MSNVSFLENTIKLLALWLTFLANPLSPSSAFFCFYGRHLTQFEKTVGATITALLRLLTSALSTLISLLPNTSSVYLAMDITVLPCS
jgi:hypothetical protein